MCTYIISFLDYLLGLISLVHCTSVAAQSFVVNIEARCVPHAELLCDALVCPA